MRAEVSCDETTEPVRIEPGQVTIIHVGPWFQKELNMPGVYRWDVVFYRARYWGTNPYLDDARHILSNVFATDK